MNVILGLDPGIKKKTVGKPAVFFLWGFSQSILYLNTTTCRRNFDKWAAAVDFFVVGVAWDELVAGELVV